MKTIIKFKGVVSRLLSVLFLVLGFFIAIFNTLKFACILAEKIMYYYNSIIETKSIKLPLRTININNIQEVIILIVVSIMLIIIGVVFPLCLATYSHEIGHWIIYKIKGANPTIHKTSIIQFAKNFMIKPKTKNKTTWAALPEDPKFNDKLRAEKPIIYIILCMAGVLTTTVASTIFTYAFLDIESILVLFL